MAEGKSPCPPWCAGKHSLTETHYSAAPRLGLGLYAEAVQRPGGRKLAGAAGVPARNEHEAAALAKLIERLAGASPGVHRALEEQVRAAASVAFGAEAMEGLR
ncbi:MAG TPA: hypothetical protein VK599_07710 [Streptosporangiaceae bacterium]|nr:hypothetical protein [Streptosporangiaceae bacterium]